MHSQLGCAPSCVCLCMCVCPCRFSQQWRNCYLGNMLCVALLLVPLAFSAQGERTTHKDLTSVQC